MILYVKGSARHLGGGHAVTQSIKDRAISIFWEWCNLARLVVRAEFPSFEIIFKFCAFDLDEGKPQTNVEQQNHIGAHLGQLAKYFNVSGDDLIDEFYR
eukprot:2811171-Pyramimonas_sp.AAC.1